LSLEMEWPSKVLFWITSIYRREWC